ncbi:hypothetical protein PHJA_002142200 [Phtheirospermum japonicum]|uniref:Protein SAR DEFICIENT 1 n=1 Tax=Phtheirospermum japonicum TaxID=374723 RepID=A0A830D0V2_9LAMI|nr:hypothetical protein PHJA_002142200 [Phtheirospermum japonicum]
MAAKRNFHGDEDQPTQKRMKIRPSFASVIREVVMVNFFENFCSALTPMLRRVVSEEVENGVRGHCMRAIVRSSSLLPAPVLHLRFGERLLLPIFTGTKIVDVHNNPLQIFLGSDNIPLSHHHLPIKIELMVVNGDFPNNIENTWTPEDFNKNIVKERSGKRPLLSGGDQFLTMRDNGVACINGDIELTDNSSWIRSRKFRLGARVVVCGGGGVIREAITEPFVVKDHRGQLYKKHHPPALEDEVWRLEKIGKGGVFHQKLAHYGINTVQDFLKLFVVDSSKLRKILGMGMSEKMWEAALDHAKTCVMGTKLYRFHANNYTLTFNPICQLVKAEFDGQIYYESDLKLMQTAYIKSLLKEAYEKWSSLEELGGLIHENARLTQGDQVMVGQHQLAVVDSNYMTSDDVVEGVYSDDWPLNFYLATDTSTCASNKSSTRNIRFLSESSSEGDY